MTAMITVQLDAGTRILAYRWREGRGLQVIDVTDQVDELLSVGLGVDDDGLSPGMSVRVRGGARFIVDDATLDHDAACVVIARALRTTQP
jgi:hypothetical protein